MGGFTPSQCLLLVLTLLVSATHGGGHPWRRENPDLRYQPIYGRGVSRLPHPHTPHSRTHGRLHTSSYNLRRPVTAFQKLLRERFPEDPLEAPLSMDPRLQDHLLSNDLGEIGLTQEDEMLYSARIHDTNQVGLDRNRQRHLSDRYQTHYEEVCTTVRRWQQLEETVDVDGNDVVIVNTGAYNQTFYSFQCVNPCQACKGVQGNSLCKMRYTYVKMYHRLKNEGPGGNAKWDFVEVPSHCSCELVPINGIDPLCIKR